MCYTNHTFPRRSRCSFRSYCHYDQWKTSSHGHTRFSQKSNRFIEIFCTYFSKRIREFLDFEYRLFIDKKEIGDSGVITRFVQDRVSEVVLEREVVSEMVFGIKRGEAKQIEQLIDGLDRESNNIGINGYGLSMTSIEDVFLK